MNQELKIKIELRVLKSDSEVPCPHCGRDVSFEWKQNSEFVARCPMPCSQLFVLRTNGATVETAKIDWLGGVIYYSPNATLSSPTAAPTAPLALPTAA